MLVIRPRSDDEARPPMPQLVAPGGYAVPREPIRVVLARDEEESEISDAAKAKPPAYGLWRESVVRASSMDVSNYFQLTRGYSGWIPIGYTGNAILMRHQMAARRTLGRLAAGHDHHRMHRKTVSATL